MATLGPHPYHSCGPSPIERTAQVTVTRVTVSDHQAPPALAVYGTQMARRSAPRGEATRLMFAVRVEGRSVDLPGSHTSRARSVRGVRLRGNACTIARRSTGRRG
jgi:hypothetical protein